MFFCVCMYVYIYIPHSELLLKGVITSFIQFSQLKDKIYDLLLYTAQNN